MGTNSYFCSHFNDFEYCLGLSASSNTGHNLSCTDCEKI